MNAEFDILRKNLKIVEGMTQDEDKFVRTKLMTYNWTQMPPKHDYLSLEVKLVLKVKGGQIFGGLMGKIYRGCMFIDILWVDESLRGNGFGEKLLGRAEKMALQERCHFIHLDTFSFQAPEFYQKMGFEIFGTLDGYDDGVKRYFLKKTL